MLLNFCTAREEPKKGLKRKGKRKPSKQNSSFKNQYFLLPFLAGTLLFPPNFGIMKMFLILSTSVRLNPVGTKIANTLSLLEKPTERNFF